MIRMEAPYCFPTALLLRLQSATRPASMKMPSSPLDCTEQPTTVDPSSALMPLAPLPVSSQDSTTQLLSASIPFSVLLEILQCLMETSAYASTPRRWFCEIEQFSTLQRSRART